MSTLLLLLLLLLLHRRLLTSQLNLWAHRVEVHIRAWLFLDWRQLVSLVGRGRVVVTAHRNFNFIVPRHT